MSRRLRFLYVVAIAVLTICAIDVAAQSPFGPCCSSTDGCSTPDALCCNPESLPKCYDSWLPFNDLDGYCMTLAGCALLN